MWFRRDLRVADHQALADAADRGPVACLWVLDPDLLARRHHQSPRRRAFLRAGLEALDGELRARGGHLVIRTGRPEQVVPRVAAEVRAASVAWTEEISPYGRDRDRRVRGALEHDGRLVVTAPPDLLGLPADLPGPDGAGYRVFTAFWRRWSELPIPGHLPAPTRIEGPALACDSLDPLARAPAPAPAGPAAARRALADFIRAGHADRYAEMRDRPADDGTSRLSAYLRFGMCTSAQIGRALGLPGAVSPGRAAFWRQLCWREFFHHLLLHQPHIARQAMRPECRRIAWDDDADGWAAWCAGRTGFTFVDAGMRQLASEGWMHNRARMVCASFLVKDLGIDWRRGETAFMRELLDGDPANNNGGWQWTAGTGADAAPFHRVFNPVLQARRFDPDGRYVRRWIPELARVPDALVHEPWRMSTDQQRAAGCVIGVDYPHPILDHAARRATALARYRAVGDRTPDGR